MFKGGHENALGDWEQTGNAGKKQKKNKSKKATIVTKNAFNNPEASGILNGTAKTSKDTLSNALINGGNINQTQQKTGSTLNTKNLLEKNQKVETVTPSSMVKQKFSSDLKNTGKINSSISGVNSIGNFNLILKIVYKFRYRRIPIT